MEQKASYHVTSSFETSKGCLVIGGMSLPRLAEKIGQTPFFAYSRDLITGRVAELRNALPSDSANLLWLFLSSDKTDGHIKFSEQGNSW